MAADRLIMDGDNWISVTNDSVYDDSARLIVCVETDDDGIAHFDLSREEIEQLTDALRAVSTGSQPQDWRRKGGGLTGSIRSNAEAAAWRSAARTMLKAVHRPLVAAVRSHSDAARAKQFSAFLATDDGKALLSFFLGVAPLVIPQLQVDPRIARLAEELRIAGIQTAIDQLFDGVTEPLIAAFTKAVTALPPMKLANE